MSFQKDLRHTSWDEIKRKQFVRVSLVKDWIELVEMKEGDVVVDIGPGPGVFTLEYAKLVSTAGKIIALEKSKEATEYLSSELHKQSIYNVEVHNVDVEKATIIHELGVINSILLTDVLHHAEDPRDILRNIRNQTMDRKTKILISEFDPESDGVIGPPIVNRLHAIEIRNWVTELGFAIVQEGKQGFEHYYLLLS